MHCSSTRHAHMDKENATVLGVDHPTVRVTRARAKALGTAGGIPSSSKPSFKHDQKYVRANSKRAASDESKASVLGPSGFQHKRRAVLKDVTNIICEDPFMHCINVTKVQTKKQARRGTSKKNPKLASDVTANVPVAHDDAKTKLAEELSKIRMEESEDTLLVNLTENETSQNYMSHHIRECGGANPELLEQPSNKPALQNSIQKEDILEQSEDLGIVDIDSDLQDPHVYSLYAPDIYKKMRVTELERRPSINYMEDLQRDITPNMRGILIDWLVEVSEEYKLVPDTLYLTVNLIDRFLSENCILKQRLQLLGVACMLIASKYEEICAPQVEEFCFITDNTYAKVEVLKMESQILNFLHFQLSVPTTKTFLRRFILAAQVSFKAPCIEMELLANYLAELTLLEYSFLKFLPSLIAASAVFLARWTLNQSDHPWNPTLEHYTNYKAPQLKTTVLALEDLQKNTNLCALHAIREKYRQLKFKRVATLTSCKPVESLF